MGKLEAKKETSGRGQMFYLWHPKTERTFSGHGISVESENRERLVGPLMVDRPYPAHEAWRQYINSTDGECQLVPMTETGERGLACQMEIEPESTQYLRTMPFSESLWVKYLHPSPEKHQEIGRMN